jgi:hypothetical protein
MGIAKVVGIGAIAAGGIAAAQSILDDGIAGCFNKDGRAHFMMDDGTLSQNPIVALNFSGDGETCTVSHGGSTPPDIYDRVDIPGSDFVEDLLDDAVSFTNEQWAQISSEEQGSPFEMLEAQVTPSGLQLFDESGEAVNGGYLGLQFAEVIMPVSQGKMDYMHATGTPEASGSAVIAYKTNEGIGLTRVPVAPAGMR